MSERKVYFREAIIRAFREEMDRDESVLLLGQDIAEFGGSYKEAAGLFAQYGPKRVRNTPVAEASMVGMGVGAAAAGLRPIVFITYMDFIMLGLDPLVNYAAKLSYKTAGQLRAPLVVKTTAGAKGQGVAHSQCLESWLMSVPGLKVVAPSTPADAYGLLKSAIREDGPVVYVDHKRLFPTVGTLPDEEFVVPFGKAAVRRPGRDVLIVSHSYLAGVALSAADLLAKEGVEAEVIDLRSLYPLDTETIVAAARRIGTVLLVEEGQIICGVGAEVACRIHEADASIRVGRLGPKRIPVSSSPVLEADAIPDARGIRDTVVALLRSLP